MLLFISEMPMQGQSASSCGIGVYRIEKKTGTLRFIAHMAIGSRCIFSCVDEERHLLYVGCEEPDPTRRSAYGDRIVALRLDPKSLLPGTVGCEAPTLLYHPAYVTVDPSASHLVVAGHATHQEIGTIIRDGEGGFVRKSQTDDAAVLLYELDEAGMIGRITDVSLHTGSGPLRTQTHAHPHSAVFSPAGDVMAVCDKGADRVFFYTLNRVKHSLGRRRKAFEARPGDEPRFCVYHPHLPILYVNHEGNTAMSVIDLSGKGAPRLLQRALPDENAEKKTGTDGMVYEHQGLAIHPSGHTLYSVIRGLNMLAVYRIRQESGILHGIQRMELTAGWPRCCAVTPDGAYVAAGTREDGMLFLYQVLPDGTLRQSDLISHGTGIACITALAETTAPA